MQEHPITLSEKHPSLLEDLVRFAGYCAPIIISQDGILIDGYKRYQLDPDIDATIMNVRSIYDAAITINRNTRSWDEIDLFLWSRWAEALGTQQEPYPEAMRKAPIEMLRALANRKLLLGQALRILETPSDSWMFFLKILTFHIKLNMNETASFMEMTFDLANRWNMKNLTHVFDHEVLNPIWNETKNDPKERGSTLLKAMRRLRYPLYQKKSEELAAAWQELHLDQLQGNKSLFLTRGMLEIKIRARSREEMSQKVGGLFESLSKPAWKRIWDE